MFEAKRYRDKAAACQGRADGATDPDDRRALHDRAQSLRTMASNEQWLSDNHDKTLLASSGNAPTAELAAEEQHILTCLGASVIMLWNTLPTKLQRELFDTAGAMGDVLETPELRGKIARFLHRHKDGDGR